MTKESSPRARARLGKDKTHPPFLQTEYQSESRLRQIRDRRSYPPPSQPIPSIVGQAWYRCVPPRTARLLHLHLPRVLLPIRLDVHRLSRITADQLETRPQKAAHRRVAYELSCLRIG